MLHKFHLYSLFIVLISDRFIFDTSGTGSNSSFNLTFFLSMTFSALYACIDYTHISVASKFVLISLLQLIIQLFGLEKK